LIHGGGTVDVVVDAVVDATVAAEVAAVLVDAAATEETVAELADEDSPLPEAFEAAVAVIMSGTVM
jgi:hypothetical protein